jgi:carbamoyltransferase
LPEERVTRRKYAGGFRYSLARGLEAIGASVSDVDRFSFASYAESRPVEVEHIVRQAPELQSARDRIVLAPSHHELHALYGFRHSPFRESLVAVLDNEGMVLGPQLDTRPFANPMERCSYYIGGPSGVDLLTRDLYGRQDISIGEAFRRFNYYCGFPSHQQSGKTMALAAYGNANRFAHIKLLSRSGGRLRIHLDPQADPPGSSVERFFARHGTSVVPSRRPGEEVHPDHMDAAAFVQGEVESFLAEELASMLGDTGLRALVLCGGVAYNCRIVGLLERMLDVPVFVPPSPGDQGICMGAVHACLETMGIRDHIDATSFLGGMPGAQQVQAGDAATRSVLHVCAPDDLPRAVACHLHAGRVVALVEGASEFGRRALGHRSLLSLPDPPLLERLRAIKQREWFRPFGVSMLASLAKRCFAQAPDRFMLRATVLEPGTCDALEPVAHADRTIRAQLIDDDDPGLLAAVLRELACLGRDPALVNTSLNRMGEPLVETFADAYELFCESPGVDVLVHGNEGNLFVRMERAS